MSVKEPIDNPFGSRPSSLPLTSINYNFVTQSMKNRFLDALESLIDSDRNPNENIYVFYGQHVNWGSNNSPNDTSDIPNTPTNSFKDDITARINMTALSKLDQTNTNLGIKKKTWRSGAIYGQYSTNLDQSQSPNDNYYIVQARPNEEEYGAIYKCLDNNGGAVSTIPPYKEISKSVKPVTLDDGYKWKYMTTIPATLLSQFNTNQSPLQDYVPLWNDVDYAGSLGTIDRIDIDSSGIGYGYSNTSPNDKYQGLFDSPVVPIFVDGDGGSVEIGTIKIASVIEPSGAITAFNSEPTELKIRTDGGGYIPIDNYPKLNNWVPVKFLEDITDFEPEDLAAINQPDRKTAFGLAKITVRGGRGIIDSPGDIVLIRPGSNYQKGKQVRIVQSSTIAYGTRFNSDTGGITKIEIANEGSGHTFATLVPVHNSPSGSGFDGTAVISPLLGHGGNPKKELNATNLFITKSIIGNYEPGTNLLDKDFSRTNDFRQIGLIRNPKKYGSDELADDPTLSAKHILTVVDNSTGDIASLNDSGSDKDLLIIGNISRAQGRIVDTFQVGNTIEWNIRYVKVGARDFRDGEKLLFANIVEPISITGINYPELDVYSGDILFINNNEPVTRDKQQTETVNLLITF